MVVTVLAASSVERAIVWLPAIVVAVGLLGAVSILLGRAFVVTVRESGHPRWILGGLVALVGAILVLTWLGVELPRE
jgi:protein-S-isoprenylcysteine O-methyltransferase Ste14